MGFQRCLELQDLKGFKSDPEMATLLLCYSTTLFYLTLLLVHVSNTSVSSFPYYGCKFHRD